MSADSEKIARFENKAKIEKAKAKAMGMRVTELAFTAGGAAALAALEVKTGRTTVSDTGMLAKVSWNALAIAAGLGGVFFGRGFVQDAASGVLNAGIVNVVTAQVKTSLAP
jgi:hypothetical protein